MLLRSIAVVSSSVATILSSMLPLFLYTSIPTEYLIILFVMLTTAAFIIHGVLTHAFNDYTDYHSGTDANSPAILSGGSRVLQQGKISIHTLWLLGKWLAIALLILAVIFAVLAQYKLTILLLIGVWGAGSYSIPPLRLSYRPFLGEWFSLFPSILFLGFAGAWLALGYVPLWAMQNAVINGLICLAWVMVHHIPDLDADKKAVPVKQTSVVWFTTTFGLYYSRFPAVIYLSMAGLCALWLGFDRVWAAGGLSIIIVSALYLVLKMKVEDHEQVSKYEKILLLLAMTTAIWLGIFI